MTAAQAHIQAIVRLLAGYGMEAVALAPGAAIPGSYWGESEAGLIGNRLYFRPDTPLHSVLHEACHFICMSASRRARLDRDAGGDHAEENAVCYLQILLAERFAGVDRLTMCRDMDEWGYTFRLGNAQSWFDGDADDASEWLRAYGIVDTSGAVTGRKRE